MLTLVYARPLFPVRIGFGFGGAARTVALQTFEDELKVLEDDTDTLDDDWIDTAVELEEVITTEVVDTLVIVEKTDAEEPLEDVRKDEAEAELPDMDEDETEVLDCVLAKDVVERNWLVVELALTGF